MTENAAVLEPPIAKAIHAYAIPRGTKLLRLDWRDPQYVPGLIDLGQEPEGLSDVEAGAEAD
jgi:hypothetical protein